MRISKSRISAFEQCQYYYKLRYVDKIKLEGEEDGTIGAGAKFHLWSEQHDKSRKSGIPLPLHVDSDWQRFWIRFAKNLQENCQEAKGDRWKEYFDPVYIEERFEAIIDGDEYTCIVDRIYKTFDDKFLLAEIKTGKASIEDVRKELCICKIIIEAVTPLKIEYFGLINPRLEIVETEKVKKISMTYARKSIERFRKVNQSGMFLKNQERCGVCEYASQCYTFANILKR